LPPAETFAALVVFAFVSAITPGPNNVMLLASGLNHGFARTIPHMLGITFGVTFMIALVGVGFAGAFVRIPWLHDAVRIAGILYMLWLAWRIARAGAPVEGTARGRPMTFLGAAAFQWVNPKAWAMFAAAVGAYTVAGEYTSSVLVIAATFGLVCAPSVAVWALFGVGLRRLLASPGLVRAFNVAMAVLLVASLWPAVVEAVASFRGT
jgi:threonine/homoserine/homoserine lactone efflux protein